jgi:hypothetical protein
MYNLYELSVYFTIRIFTFYAKPLVALRTVFASSTTGVVGSNPTQGTDVCLYSVFV